MPNGKKLTQAETEALRSDYSAAAAATLLDDAFGKWDNRRDNSGVPYLDRADHIIIGGRTATELLMEPFNEALPNMRAPDGRPYGSRDIAYSAFLRGEGKETINRMVAAALATGEKVEVFVPDRFTGRIQDQPMRLSARGYEPAGPLVKPKQLNGWQKFWSKLGFYKKEKAAVENYERETAARQKVKFCNRVAQAGFTSNFAMIPDYLEEVDRFQPELRSDMAKSFPESRGNPASLGAANGFRTVRSSFYATAIEYLATRRDGNGELLYTNEQLFDMGDPKMQKARADAIRETYERYKAGDTDWLVDLQYAAAPVLRQRISAQAAKLDFSRSDVTAQKGYRELAMLSDTAFDESQDLVDTRRRMEEKYGKSAYQDAAGLVGDCSQVCRHLTESMIAQKYLLNGIHGRDESAVCKEIAHVLRGEAYRQEMAKSIREQPGRSFADIANESFVNRANDVFGEAGYDDDMVRAHDKRGNDLPRLMEQNVNLAREHLADPEKFGRQLTGGVFERRIRLDQLTPDGDVPTAFTIRPAAEVEREMKQQTTGGSVR